MLPGFGRLAKARKSKESKARTPRQSHRGPGCTGNRARMHRQSPARKARPGYPGKKRSPGKRPGSPGKATGDGQEALAKGLCTTQRARKHRQSHPRGPQEALAKPPGRQEALAKAPGGPGSSGKVPGFRVCTFVIATSVRVITCRVKQLWRPSVSALPEPPDLCHQSLADRSDGFGLPGWVTSPQPDFRV